jgi:hypothetical protein
MKILITGGAGYLGSVLTEVLLNKGYYVTVLDNLVYKQTSVAPFAYHPNFDFVLGDVTNESTLKSLVDNLNSNIDPKDAYVINSEGKRVIRPEFSSQITNFMLYEKMKDAALAKNDTEAYDLLEKKQFAEVVAAKHQAGKLEEYIDELEVLGKSSPEEIKQILGENPLDKDGNVMSPRDIANTKIAEAKRIASMIDGVSQIKEFSRLSPQAKNHIAAMLVEQDAIAESHKNIILEKAKLKNAPIIPSKKKVKIEAPANEFGLSDLEVEEDDYTNHRHEFIHLRTRLDRPFYIWDAETDTKIETTSYATFFNDQDWHNGGTANVQTFSIRIDGEFTDEFRKTAGFAVDYY